MLYSHLQRDDSLSISPTSESIVLWLVSNTWGTYSNNFYVHVDVWHCDVDADADNDVAIDALGCCVADNPISRPSRY